MKFTKAPPELIAVFEAAVPGAPAEKRKMFGYPAAFVNRNMFMSIFGDAMFLRLGDSDAQKLLAIPGAKPFEPMPGRAMRGYIVVPGKVLADRTELSQLVKKSFAHAQSLPAKTQGSRKSAKRKSK